MTIRPRRAISAAAVAALLALSGCGGGGDDDKASDSSTTPSATASSSTATDTSESTSSGSDSGLADVMSKTIKDGKSAHVTLDLGSQGSGEGDISFDGDSPQMQLSISAAGQKTEMRMVDNVIYVAVPGQDGKFIKTSAGATGALGGMDPSQALEELEKTSGQAKEVGDGHWRLSADGSTTDLYVGDDGYLSKVEVDAAGTKMTMTYSDWGKDVHVEAPSKSDIVDMPTS
jgi:hypothetical protein